MGSYPQPGWLIDKDRLLGAGVPRVRSRQIWRVDEQELDEAIEAATLVAIADQDAAGIDLITDGEIGRESYFNHFANALGGVDPERIGQGVNRRGGVSQVPLVTGPIERTEPIELEAARFLIAHTDRKTKVTVPGPFTLSQLADDRHYGNQRDLAMAYADAVNQELVDLQAAGVDMLQLDEPYLQANAEAAREFAVEAITRAVRGITAATTLHTCYGYAVYVSNKTSGYPFLDELADAPVDFVAIEAAQPNLDPSIVARLAPRGVVLGVIDLGRESVETPREVADRVAGALEHTTPDKLMIAPDCGMKYLPRDRARAKLAAMVQGVGLASGTTA